MEAVLLGSILRVIQAVVEASGTVLVGVVVAGVFRRLLGYDGTRRLFGNHGWRTLPQAWLIGMLLPVCSLGVIPVVREMRRAGVSGGAVLAFGLTAPLFNPISVLYGLTLADPLVILTFSFCSLVIVTVVGVFWDYWYPEKDPLPPEPPKMDFGVKRMFAVIDFSARELAGPAAMYAAIGLAGVGLLALVLPQGCLQTAAEPEDPWAPLCMTLVAIPAYATPITAMVQLASMFQHGNSVGAAFSLLVLGAGANLGLVFWMAANYGWRRTATWFLVLLVVVVGLAYGVDKPLYPRGVESAGHTHAFDGYCAPFQPGTTEPVAKALVSLRDGVEPHEILSLGVLAALAAYGAALRLWDRTGRVERWLLRPAGGPRRLDVVVPGPVLGGLALVGLVAASVFGCYVYYPPPEEIFKEMTIVNTEVVAAAYSRHWDNARYWIPIFDDWTRKLQVSMVLRGKRVTPYQRAKADVLRIKLELLEHEVEDQEVEEARRMGLAVHRAYRRMRDAYRPTGTGTTLAASFEGPVVTP